MMSKLSDDCWFRQEHLSSLSFNFQPTGRWNQIGITYNELAAVVTLRLARHLIQHPDATRQTVIFTDPTGAHFH